MHADGVYDCCYPGIVVTIVVDDDILLIVLRGTCYIAVITIVLCCYCIVFLRYCTDVLLLRIAFTVGDDCCIVYCYC